MSKMDGYLLKQQVRACLAHMSSSKRIIRVGSLAHSGAGCEYEWIVGIYSGDSGTQQIFNNTIIGPNNTDNTLCLGVAGLSNVSIQNNVISNCGNPIAIDSSLTREHREQQSIGSIVRQLAEIVSSVTAVLPRKKSLESRSRL